MQNYNDIDLLFIRILTRDDVTAYKKLFFDFFAPLCLFAKRYVEQKEVCEDIVQGVFFQLWKNRHQITITTSARSFLVTSVRNACIDWVRRRELETAYQEKQFVSGVSNEEDTTILYAVSELEEHLNMALAKLPENVRHTFEMNRFDGKTYLVIAEECGISVKTVEAHISRALKLLRSELKDFLPLLLLFLEP